MCSESEWSSDLGLGGSIVLLAAGLLIGGLFFGLWWCPYGSRRLGECAIFDLVHVICGRPCCRHTGELPAPEDHDCEAIPESYWHRLDRFTQDNLDQAGSLPDPEEEHRRRAALVKPMAQTYISGERHRCAEIPCAFWCFCCYDALSTQASPYEPRPKEFPAIVRRLAEAGTTRGGPAILPMQPPGGGDDDAGNAIHPGVMPPAYPVTAPADPPALEGSVNVNIALDAVQVEEQQMAMALQQSLDEQRQ